MWKEDNPKLPDNRNPAISRMKNLDKMFKSDPALAIKYKKDIRDYTEKRQGRKGTPKEDQKVAPITSYVPRYAA